VRRAGLTPAAAAALAARAAYAALRARPPGGEPAWTRVNHRGEPVTLLAGPAVALGAVAGAALAAGLGTPSATAAIVAGTGAAGFGGYDDLAGDGASKGFRGHLGALARGELTTGAVKLAGIGATSIAAALIVARRRGGRGTAADVLIDAGLIAGGANLLNLFDLRPGRAIKVTLLAGGLLAVAAPAAGRAGRRGPAVGPAGLAAPPVAAATALLAEDLGERAMLGDAGANAVGAMLGVAATTLPRPARVALLAGVVGLTAASERVSFTQVIERTPALRWLDLLGRRPAAPAGPDRTTPESAGDAEPAQEPR
jgi:UDP-GlcNAc:undecaprenyl-phosphate/decaprenyl-phosphate GlcNAc-1-phosphate transferase